MNFLRIQYDEINNTIAGINITGMIPWMKIVRFSGILLNNLKCRQVKIQMSNYNY